MLCNMPQRPLRPCPRPGCGQLTRGGPCERHRRQSERDRGSASARGYGRRWQKAREIYLAEHPWCAECLRHGHRVLAQEVDHIIPHRGDPALFWRRSNWQSLCKTHHSEKTARGE